jgi:hypothetical protein
MGSVHVAIMSTEHDFRYQHMPTLSRFISIRFLVRLLMPSSRTGSAQWQWLQADLAAVDRRITPWLLVMGHRPMYIDRSVF